MATPGKRPPSGTSGARRQRPAPLIELKASEVASEPVATPPPPPQEPLQEPLHETFRAQPEPPPYEPPEPPRRDPPQSEARADEPQRPFLAWLPQELPWPLVGAGAAGAACTLLLLAVLWLVWPSSRDPVATLGPRLATIETQLRDLASRPAAAPGVDPKAIDELAARMARLESAVATPRPAATDPIMLSHLTANENAVKSLNDTVVALAKQIETAAAAARDATARADEAAVAAREARSRADSATAALADVQINARNASAGTDRALRLAVAASALRNAVERGDPYAAELAAARPLAIDANALAPLEPFAAEGVPSHAALAQELAALLQPMLRAAGSTIKRDGNFLDRLQANAERLVRIRPVDEPPGDDPVAVLARIEARAAHADTAGALTELGKLPAAVRAPAQPWIAKAEARDKAVAASRRFAGDAIAALKPAM